MERRDPGGGEPLALGVCPPKREDRTQAQGQEGGVEKIGMELV